MSLRSFERKYPKEEMNLAAQNLLVASTNPTISVFKTILLRNKKHKKAKDEGKLTEFTTNKNYGFVRGADYFGGNQK